MGFMGLGMNSEFKRKPKKAFKKLKNILGKPTKADDNTASEKLSEERKIEIAHEVNLDRKKTLRNTVFTLTVIISALTFGTFKAVDHIAAKSAKARINYLITTWQNNVKYLTEHSDIPVYQNYRYTNYMAQGDSLMQAHLYEEAAQKYYNASIVYDEDSAALFNQMKAMLASCKQDAKYCSNAISLVKKLMERYPQSPVLLDWEKQLEIAQIWDTQMKSTFNLYKS